MSRNTIKSSSGSQQETVAEPIVQHEVTGNAHNFKPSPMFASDFDAEAAAIALGQDRLKFILEALWAHRATLIGISIRLKTNIEHPISLNPNPEADKKSLAIVEEGIAKDEALIHELEIFTDHSGVR